MLNELVQSEVTILLRYFGNIFYFLRHILYFIEIPISFFYFTFN